MSIGFSTTYAGSSGHVSVLGTAATVTVGLIGPFADALHQILIQQIEEVYHSAFPLLILAHHQDGRARFGSDSDDLFRHFSLTKRISSYDSLGLKERFWKNRILDAEKHVFRFGKVYFPIRKMLSSEKGTGKGVQEKKQKEVNSQQSSTASFEFRNGRRCANVDRPEDRSDRTTNPITKPDLNKAIPGKLLHMIKDLTFDGKNDSNPIVHMENFVDICDLFKTEEGRDDAIRLRVFPLTLTGEAKAWLRSLEPSSITTWEGLRSKCLSRFFPPSKIDKLRAEIRSFRQDDEETISESWERFKHLLNSCPSHGLSKSEQVQTFYSGLGYSSRATLDSSAGGVFMYKTPTEGYKLLEDMLIHNIYWRTDKRLQIPRMTGKISTDFDPSDELAAMKNQQVKFERKIEELIKSVHDLQVGCEECKGPHLTKDCPNRPMMTPEEVHYLNRGDYQGRWNNNHNFIPRPPGFFAQN
ncbi:hypothetical protein OSB04_019910 [Centaurea solstitialis]|uniref:Retrotransposon gag domain-containing protein n=1 Tax=Centaurea solstitialis TaxID=347529 RepID=A0AA38W5F4_9ASTR|nr:hypothetical protein OSB04_019910 [Centaurea solstitialis]